MLRVAHSGLLSHSFTNCFFGGKRPAPNTQWRHERETTPLIVDDDSEIFTLLSGFLGQYGYRVSVATNGGAMMQTLASAKIDLVVLDIMLPGKDGLALCRSCGPPAGCRSSC